MTIQQLQDNFNKRMKNTRRKPSSQARGFIIAKPLENSVKDHLAVVYDGVLYAYKKSNRKMPRMRRNQI